MPLQEPREPMRIQKMIYAASACKYPGGALTLEGTLPLNGSLLRSPWFDAKEEAFCTWTKVPADPSEATKKSIFHVFAADADMPNHLNYGNSAEIDGQVFHLMFEIL